jgi:hydrogenase expression/formation protein HypC
MCLGIPGKVVEIYEQNGLPMGKLDFGGLKKEVCLAYVPEIELGDYAIVHVGFAITRIDERSAQETLNLLRQMQRVEEELGAGQEPEGELEEELDHEVS